VKTIEIVEACPPIAKRLFRTRDNLLIARPKVVWNPEADAGIIGVSEGLPVLGARLEESGLSSTWSGCQTRTSRLGRLRPEPILEAPNGWRMPAVAVAVAAAEERRAAFLEEIRELVQRASAVMRYWGLGPSPLHGGLRMWEHDSVERLEGMIRRNENPLCR
jgi:hypothetical protein